MAIPLPLKKGYQMKNSSKTDIIEFYNNFLPQMKVYHLGHNARLNRIKNSLDGFIKSDMQILDVGCGTGTTSKHMAQLGAKVTAIDIAPKLIEYAKEHSKHDNVTYLAKDVFDVDCEIKYDAIILADVFEHIPRGDVFSLFWWVIKHISHEKTYIYLDVPDYNFQTFAHENYPEKQQIIDEAWTIEDIVSLFKYWGFVPLHMHIHGIDTGAQFNEYLFVTEDSLTNHYRERLNLIYKGDK